MARTEKITIEVEVVAKPAERLASLEYDRDFWQKESFQWRNVAEDAQSKLADLQARYDERGRTITNLTERAKSLSLDANRWQEIAQENHARAEQYAPDYRGRQQIERLEKRLEAQLEVTADWKASALRRLSHLMEIETICREAK